METPASNESATPPQLSAEEKTWAAFSYLWFLSVLILIWKRDSVFISHHAQQGALLLVGFILFWAVVPPVGWLLELAVLIGIFWGFFQALNGKEWLLPYIGRYAQKIKL